MRYFCLPIFLCLLLTAYGISKADSARIQSRQNEAVYNDVNGLSHYISSSLFRSYSSQIVTNTITETSLLNNAGIGTVTLPTNYFTKGKTIKFEAIGALSHTAASNNVTINLKLGGTTIATVTKALTTVHNNLIWKMEGFITCREVGASGKVFAQGTFHHLDSSVDDTGHIFQLLNMAPDTIDTTASQVFGLTWTWDVADTGNNIMVTNFILKEM